MYGIATALVVLIMLLIVRSVIRSRAVIKGRSLRWPTHVAWDAYSINYKFLAEKGVKVVVIDVDRTLCKLGLTFRQKRLPERSITLLNDLSNLYGMYVILATKSNKHVSAMVQQLGSPAWVAYMIGSKSQPDFPDQVMQLIHCRGWDFKPYDKIVVIGDKPTDMGAKVEANKSYFRVLTNPAWGGHDLIFEYVALRRTRDRWLLERGHRMRRALIPGSFGEPERI